MNVVAIDTYNVPQFPNNNVLDVAPVRQAAIQLFTWNYYLLSSAGRYYPGQWITGGGTNHLHVSQPCYLCNNYFLSWTGSVDG